VSCIVRKVSCESLHKIDDLFLNNNYYVFIDTLLEVNGAVAYVAQQAWIRNASIRDNILFGRPFDEERYALTLEVCALLPDLQVLSAGDATGN